MEYKYTKYDDEILSTKEQEIMDMPQSVTTKGDKTLMPRYFI